MACEAPANRLAGIPTPVPAASHYLARQPILDLRGRVHGYELLFRGGPLGLNRGNDGVATRTMIDNTVVFGLPKLTGGLLAFVNCTAETLTQQDIGVLPPSMTVLEVLEDVEPTPEVVAACRKFKKEGFRLALDDFVFRPALEPLIRLADYIKIDFLSTGEAERRMILARLEGFTGALLAEKVENQREYEQARQEGFTLFQGYFFCEPMLMARRKVPANRLVHLKLLQLLQETPLNIKRVSELVKRDPSLAFRLLRLVNSSAFAQQRDVDSIPAALITVGDDLFRRIATIAVANELNSGASGEILRMALTRARFCEVTASGCSFEPTEQYLLGLFSLLPAMLQMCMKDALSGLPLREEVGAALMGQEVPIRCPLQWLEFHERGDWANCDAMGKLHGMESGRLLALFTEALLWADQTLSASFAVGR